MDLPINYKKTGWITRKRARKEYIIKQKGLCYYCKEFLDKPPPKEITKLKINKKLFPKNFFQYPIHLHHNHKTEMTIGAVHCECNAVLWQYHGE